MAHTYIIGSSGSGKSTLLLQLMLDAIHAGDGVFFFDPHGEDVDTLIHHIPRRRRRDTVLMDVSDTEYPVGWNPLADIRDMPRTASAFTDTIKQVSGYAHAPTPVLDMYTYHSLYALMDSGLSLIAWPRLLTDSAYRGTLSFSDPFLKDFWDTFDKLPAKDQRQETASTLNKALTLTGDPRLRNILGQHRSIDVADILTGKILLAKLPQGILGIGKVRLLASLLLSQLHLAALARDPDPPFHFFLDEVHHLAPDIVTEMLSGIRKFGCTLTVAHQYVGQLDPALFTALMGNCRERHVFRLSQEDARLFQQSLGMRSASLDLDELPPYRFRTFPRHSSDRDRWTEPLANPYAASARDIRENARRNHATQRWKVEQWNGDITRSGTTSR